MSVAKLPLFVTSLKVGISVHIIGTLLAFASNMDNPKASEDAA